MPLASRSTRDWDAHDYTPAAGTRIHAASCGPENGARVVCVPGLGVSHKYFLRFARALPEARVTAVDLPGFGLTHGPRKALNLRELSLALADWLRVTGFGGPGTGTVLVANSMGCQVVVDLAVHSPELLGPVVLAGPSVDDEARGAVRQVARLAVDGLIERPQLVKMALQGYFGCGLPRCIQTLSFSLGDPIEDKVHLVPTRALVVRGSRDIIVPRRWAMKLAERMPRGEFHEIVGGSHAVHDSHPDELASLTWQLLP